jgi:hypothetical protein
LNCLPYMILCFFSTFGSETNFGVATLLGSDAFNNFLILAIIFVKYKESNHGVLNPWNT